MSINGVLEDLALADVLQFVHLGRRTGTLYLWQDDEHRAEIGFHEGRIISAWTPGHRKLGDLLVAAGMLDSTVLQQALAAQRRENNQRTIGQILLSSGAVEHSDVQQVIKEQVEATIFDLVTWQQGNFHFEVDELNPVDAIGLEPGDVLDNLDLNTQMLLLEATRIFDERHRDQPPAPAAPGGLDEKLKRAGLAGAGTGAIPVVKDVETYGSRETNGRAPSGGDGTYRQRSAERTMRRGVEPAVSLEAFRCQVVSDDHGLLRELSSQLPETLVRVVSVRIREAGNRLPGEGASPLVVLDLRSGSLTLADLSTLTRTRPSAPLLAVVDAGADKAEAYGAGALAVVEKGESVVDCCRSMIRVFSHPQPQGTFGYGLRGGLARFRQAICDVQSGLLSATMALNLMHVISESVERAILFLVQGDELRAVGAFGFAADGGSLASLTRGLRLEVGREGGFRRVMGGSEPLSLEFEAAELPLDLARLLGRPASGQIVLFPVFGAERLISLIYTDNGEQPEEIQDIQILELATSQVGLAFENELISQRMDGGIDGGSMDGPAS